MRSEQKTSVKATYILLAATIIGFVIEIGIGIEAAREYVLSRKNLLESGYVLVTYGFLHSGFTHLAGNLASLFLQGKLLEKTVGSVKMAAIYLGGMIGGGVTWLIFNAGVTVSGASAATSAVMAANMVISPGKSLIDEVPLIRDLPLPGLRGLFNVSLWSAVAILVNIELALEGTSAATLAHLGGMAAGTSSVFLFTEKASYRGIAATSGFAVALSTLVLAAPGSLLWTASIAAVALLILAVRRTRKRSV
ncbi:MAG: rhomboid family intramembrane serine protease [Candidatus Nanohaloarchaea archaeon]